MLAALGWQYCYEIHPYAAPVRRLWPSRAFRTYALMGESSLLTVSTAERRAHKDRSGAGYRKSRSGVQGSLEAESRWMFVKDLDRRSMGLNRGDRREWIDYSASGDSQERPVKFAGIISVHIRCNS
ncbi:hypothetical protein Zmor_023400 [Zophobas morio]|uniref:Uncharacterized protein n=1 Tax=Zophobas morio TaxID=2755281 RepID=A0AA38HZB2_9CUCU|nr:hypothetical protein Zmor_023400 [Zophobas morio]